MPYAIIIERKSELSKDTLFLHTRRVNPFWQAIGDILWETAFPRAFVRMRDVTHKQVTSLSKQSLISMKIDGF